MCLSAVYLNDDAVVSFFCLLIAHVSSRSSVHLRNNVVENLLELILSWTLTVDVCVCTV